ncbi:MAG: SDR family oxidoreductase [Candidatus Dormibacteraeota bacterium]|uniref:SDR family oxidoreductase n=1 Tax=Candidatus Dormiibacter inghamiae TaxID=3127013 RepID=A0A934KHM0_9BACT|nr:SDR family oxidoreductase [Candidatus Dormibacteraeota bacterium]MBJ7607285.1 SDR family oxidoreductase [Candidatus Dormibacteraeota bacterium]
MTDLILVTGAGGNIGGPLVSRLVAMGLEIRILSRDPADKSSAAGTVQVIQGDLDRRDTLDRALDGVTRLFALSPGPDVPLQDANLLSAAERARVRQVVLLSSLGAELGGIGGGSQHLPGEVLLRESGLPWTILHPSEFMTNTTWWADSIAAASAIFVPSGTGRVALIDPTDIAEVAAHVLTTPQQDDGKIYRLTGPEPMTTADIAAHLTDILGRSIRHIDIPAAEFSAQLLKSGLPPPLVDLQLKYYAAVKAGTADVVTSDVEQLLSRPATGYRTWLEQHAALFR